jgi:hypothetical protein
MQLPFAPLEPCHNHKVLCIRKASARLLRARRLPYCGPQSAREETLWLPGPDRAIQGHGV